MNDNLALPICPCCGETKSVKYFSGHNKLAQPYACVNCKIYWASDLGIQKMLPSQEQYVKEILK